MGPLVIPIAAAAISAAPAIYNIFDGKSKQRKGQREADELNANRSSYKISRNYYDNVNIMENRAQGGLDQQTLSDLYDQNARGLAASNSAITRAGGSLNMVNAAYDTFLQANQNIAVKDEAMQMQNVALLLEQKSALAREEGQEWAINIWSKWQDRMLAANQLRMAGAKQFSDGISGLANAAGLGLKLAGAPQIPNSGDGSDGGIGAGNSGTSGANWFGS
jgi:hypothetical protein